MGIRQRRANVILWISIALFFTLCIRFIRLGVASGHARHGRHLLSSSSCSSQADWIKQGGVALYFIGICYLFIGISEVSTKYFIIAMDKIVQHLKLSEDVGGATFMAAGSSAPELFASLVALTNDNASNDIGVGTIVGSAVFNILVIVGVTALFSGQTLYLDYRPLIRDCVFYAAAILGIVGIFYDGKVHWWEGLISLGFYSSYVIFMVYNKKIMAKFPEHKFQERDTTSNQINCISDPQSNMQLLIQDEAESSDVHSPNTEKDNLCTNGTTAPAHNVASSGREEAPRVEQARFGGDAKVSISHKIFSYLSYPWEKAFIFTIPNCAEEKWEKWFMLTFTFSILWIGIISWFMVEWAADIGCVLGIPSAVMGVTVLAAGTSVPDALASIGVAKKGKGDMAIANVIGSNIFDIWVGLGLPWLVVVPFKDTHDTYGPYLSVNNDDLLPSVFILLGVLFFYIGAVLFTKWKLYEGEGYFFILLYGVYALYYIIVVWALDVFHSED